jgi:hypothetical protein
VVRSLYGAPTSRGRGTRQGEGGGSSPGMAGNDEGGSAAGVVAVQ